MKTTTTTKCLVPNCNKMAKHRGLCNSHYAYVRLLVVKKETTWQKLEEAKKILPKKVRTGDPIIRKFFLGD